MDKRWTAGRAAPGGRCGARHPYAVSLERSICRLFLVDTRGTITSNGTTPCGTRALLSELGRGSRRRRRGPDSAPDTRPANRRQEAGPHPPPVFVGEVSGKKLLWCPVGRSSFGARGKSSLGFLGAAFPTLIHPRTGKRKGPARRRQRRATVSTNSVESTATIGCFFAYQSPHEWEWGNRAAPVLRVVRRLSDKARRPRARQETGTRGRCAGRGQARDGDARPLR